MLDFMSYYAEYGAVGVVIALFVWGYIKQGQRADEQANSLEELRVENKGQSNDISNISFIFSTN